MSTLEHRLVIPSPTSARREPRERHRDWIARHQVAAFFVGALAFSWLLWHALGAGFARQITDGPAARRGWPRVPLYARRGVTALVGVGLLALAVAIARPATTDPILGPDGRPLAGSIAEPNRPLFEQPDRFHEVMAGTVLAETRPGR